MQEKSKYIFYKDSRLISIIIILTALVLQIGAFTHTPVLVTIHTYSVGILFGRYSTFFYLYCLLMVVTIIFQNIRILHIIKLTQLTYWFFSLSLMTALVTWFYYTSNLSINTSSLGTGAFKQSFKLWWNNYNSPSSSWWDHSTPDAGVIGALLYSIVASFSTTIVTAIIYSCLAILGFSLIVTGTWIGLYRNIILHAKNTKNKVQKNEDSIVNRESPFISIDDNFKDDNKKSSVILPFCDVSELEGKPAIKWDPYPKIDPEKVLDTIKNDPLIDLANNVSEHKRAINNLFTTFNIDAHVVDAIVGPTLTKLIIKTSSNTNLKKIANIQQNIKMVLETKEVRMQLPIPGKALIGIEYPNKKRKLVSFKEVLKDKRKIISPLSIPLGKSIDGKTFILNINETPHLLIAGATGSGKSTSINIIIISLIMNISPKDLRLVLIDPKFVEFVSYKNIPHLLAPIITDSMKAAYTLKMIVNIMEDRYKIMSKHNVKKIEQYNAIAKTKKLEHWPYIVIVIDELADLMSISSKLVETSIQRLTQKARAIGIHLILATQRPSTNVVTGVIKANIPSRIAFSVSASIDSRVILDEVGAEKLIGHGDMLISLYGKYMERVQCAFISNSEIEKVVQAVAKYGKPNFDSRLLDEYDTNDDIFSDNIEGY